MQAESARLLLIDDDESFRAVLARSLMRRGFEVRAVAGADEALAACMASQPGYVILDLNLAGRSGLQLIAPLLRLAPEVRILVLTGYASIPTVVSAMKLGAVHYLAKPADVAEIVAALRDDEPVLTEEAPPPQQRLSVRHLEWEYIQRTLDAHDGNVSATARALGMHRRTLQRKLGKRRPPVPVADG
jgi:two-component system response regulator RegA